MHPIEELRELNRENLHRIWRAKQDGRSHPPEERRIAEAMLAHPEYHHAWGFSDVVGPAPYEIEGVNPFLHIAAHAMTDAQLEANDPPEAAQAVQRLRRNGIDRHQAIHQIAAVMFEVMFPVLKVGKAFDIERYRKRLVRLGRR